VPYYLYCVYLYYCSVILHYLRDHIYYGCITPYLIVIVFIVIYLLVIITLYWLLITVIWFIWHADHIHYPLIWLLPYIYSHRILYIIGLCYVFPILLFHHSLYYIGHCTSCYYPCIIVWPWIIVVIPDPVVTLCYIIYTFTLLLDSVHLLFTPLTFTLLVVIGPYSWLLFCIYCPIHLYIAHYYLVVVGCWTAFVVQLCTLFIIVRSYTGYYVQLYVVIVVVLYLVIIVNLLLLV